jgi:hypothetical protein
MVPVKEPVAVPATRTELFDNVGLEVVDARA